MSMPSTFVWWLNEQPKGIERAPVNRLGTRGLCGELAEWFKAPDS